MKPFKNRKDERDEIMRIGNAAVYKAQQDSLKNGVPNVYSKNGTLYYQLPNGDITMEDPFKKEKNHKKRRLNLNPFKNQRGINTAEGKIIAHNMRRLNLTPRPHNIIQWRTFRIYLY